MSRGRAPLDASGGRLTTGQELQSAGGIVGRSGVVAVLEPHFDAECWRSSKIAFCDHRKSRCGIKESRGRGVWRSSVLCLGDHLLAGDPNSMAGGGPAVGEAEVGFVGSGVTDEGVAGSGRMDDLVA